MIIDEEAHRGLQRSSCGTQVMSWRGIATDSSDSLRGELFAYFLQVGFYSQNSRGLSARSRAEIPFSRFLFCSTKSMNLNI